MTRVLRNKNLDMYCPTKGLPSHLQIELTTHRQEQLCLEQNTLYKFIAISFSSQSTNRKRVSMKLTTACGSTEKDCFARGKAVHTCPSSLCNAMKQFMRFAKSARWPTLSDESTRMPNVYAARWIHLDCKKMFPGILQFYFWPLPKKKDQFKQTHFIKRFSCCSHATVK